MVSRGILCLIFIVGSCGTLAGRQQYVLDLTQLNGMFGPGLFTGVGEVAGIQLGGSDLTPGVHGNPIVGFGEVNAGYGPAAGLSASYGNGWDVTYGGGRFGAGVGLMAGAGFSKSWTAATPPRCR
jgi:hypothetical protein